METRLRFSLHRRGGLVLRARGLRRYYAAVFSGGDRLAIVARHNDAVYTLAQASFAYEMERRYALYFAAAGNRLSLAVDGIPCLRPGTTATRAAAPASSSTRAPCSPTASESVEDRLSPDHGRTPLRGQGYATGNGQEGHRKMLLWSKRTWV